MSTKCKYYVGGDYRLDFLYLVSEHICLDPKMKSLCLKLYEKNTQAINTHFGSGLFDAMKPKTVNHPAYDSITIWRREFTPSYKVTDVSCITILLSWIDTQTPQSISARKSIINYLTGKYRLCASLDNAKAVKTDPSIFVSGLSATENIMCVYFASIRFWSESVSINLEKAIVLQPYLERFSKQRYRRALLWHDTTATDIFFEILEKERVYVAGKQPLSSHCQLNSAFVTCFMDMCMESESVEAVCSRTVPYVIDLTDPDLQRRVKRSDMLKKLDSLSSQREYEDFLGERMCMGYCTECISKLFDRVDSKLEMFGLLSFDLVTAVNVWWERIVKLNHVPDTLTRKEAMFCLSVFVLGNLFSSNGIKSLDDLINYYSNISEDDLIDSLGDAYFRTLMSLMFTCLDFGDREIVNINLSSGQESSCRQSDERDELVNGLRAKVSELQSSASRKEYLYGKEAVNELRSELREAKERIALLESQLSEAKAVPEVQPIIFEETAEPHIEILAKICSERSVIVVGGNPNWVKSRRLDTPMLTYLDMDEATPSVLTGIVSKYDIIVANTTSLAHKVTFQLQTLCEAKGKELHLCECATNRDRFLSQLVDVLERGDKA